MGMTSSNPYVSGQLGNFEAEILSAFQTAADRVKSGAADAAIARWFGDTTAATKTHVRTALIRMRTILNCQTIQVAFASLQRLEVKDGTGNVVGTVLGRSGSNAAAQASTVGLLSINSALPSYAGTGFSQSNMWLDEGFAKLPDYLPLAGGAVDASDGNQSKFNTIVHELSHLLLGTVDCVAGDDTTMYGAKNAEGLALHGLAYVPSTGYTPPYAALYNAENWGIFVEAAGRNRGT